MRETSQTKKRKIPAHKSHPSYLQHCLPVTTACIAKSRSSVDRRLTDLKAPSDFRQTLVPNLNHDKMTASRIKKVEQVINSSRNAIWKLVHLRQQCRKDRKMQATELKRSLTPFRLGSLKNTQGLSALMNIVHPPAATARLCSESKPQIFIRHQI